MKKENGLRRDGASASSGGAKAARVGTAKTGARRTMSGNENGKQERGSVYRVFRTAFAAAFEIRLGDAAPLFDAENEPNDELERVRRRVERWSVEERRDFSTFRARKAAFVEASAALAEYLRDVGVEWENVEDESARFGWEALTAAGGSASQALFLGRLETATLEFGRAFSFLTNEERTAARLAAALAQAFLTESANAAASLRRIDAETFDASAPKSSFGAFWRLKTDARDALAALAGRPTTKEIWRSQGRLFWERAASEPNEAVAETAFRLARATRAAENDDWAAAFDALERIKIGDDAELNDAVKRLRVASWGEDERDRAAFKAETERAPAGFGPGREPGERRTAKVKWNVEIALRWVPPGEFEVGSPANEEGRRVDEPLHRATLTRGVWLAEAAVSQRLWKEIMRSSPSRFSAKGRGAAAVDEAATAPVESVSWDDCQAFLKKLNACATPPGWRFRLPTEAEWERACRAGTTTRYYWGDDWNGGNDGAVNAKEGADVGRTRRVRDGKANPWGFFNMLGNVAEWCEDYYCVDYHVENAVDPTGPATGGKAGARVVRGGAFDDLPNDCRSASRRDFGPTVRRSDVGFRLALAETEPKKVASGNSASQPSVAAGLVGPRKRRVILGRRGVEFAFRRIPTSALATNGAELNSNKNKEIWILETPVTQRMWEAVMETNPSWFGPNGGGAWEIVVGETGDWPAENVSWNDCREFLARVNRTGWGAGGTFRLPTEAEWEVAAQAGEPPERWKNDWDDGVGRWLGRTRRVGGGANPWGISDFNGNVSEWVADLAETAGGAFKSPPKPGAFVIRGGGWRGSRTGERITTRDSAPPDYKGNY
ncbi:MAG: formylglycine-generating enzyme family protein, partial [Thermoguttaceae bacterium]|nr:formylglycine-generating enzyme family protein [Thermoguttaceae bacterium]